MEKDELDAISFRIIQAAINVHRQLGPGLLESIYRQCMVVEMRAEGLHVAVEQAVPLQFRGVVLDGSYRIDLLINHEIIVEIKAVEKVIPVHYAQLLSYLRLTGKRLGLLINFNVPLLARGIKRIVNHF
jgi:GxxExxY protein